MNNPRFFRDLPPDYAAVKTADAIGNKRLAVLLNLAALGLSVLSGFVFYLARFGLHTSPLSLFIRSEADSLIRTESFLLLTAVLLLVYILLHELTHGAAYKLCTGEKLTFGISLSCAYCGVPHIYVTRRTALISLLAPFLLYSAVGILCIFLLSGIYALGAVLLFAVHFGGCAGDLYNVLLFLTVFRGDVLMRDTGPKQVFYQRRCPSRQG